MSKKVDRTKELEKQHEDLTIILKQKAAELKKNHRFEEAMELMNKVYDLENNRRPENFWNETGIHLCNMGKYEDALECFDKDLQREREYTDMPCYITGSRQGDIDYYNDLIINQLEDKTTKVTQMLCKACKALDDNGIKIPRGLGAWWKKHKEQDGK